MLKSPFIFNKNKQEKNSVNAIQLMDWNFNLWINIKQKVKVEG